MTRDELALLIEVVQRPERPRETLEERVALIETHQAISDRIQLYGLLCDTRSQWDDLMAIYTEDYEWHVAGTVETRLHGRDAVLKVYREMQAKDTETTEFRHLIHPAVIRVSDDGRTAQAVAVYTLVKSSGTGADYSRGGHQGGYLLDLRFDEDHGWRFSKMMIITEQARNAQFASSAAS